MKAKNSDSFRNSIRNFIQYAESKETMAEYVISQMCSEFGFQKRRLYDVINVLEPVGICKKTSVDTIQWNGRKYHLDCFKCKKCGTKLNQDNWVRVHEYPYCEKCYKEYRDSKAAAAWKQANERKRTRRLKRTKKD